VYEALTCTALQWASRTTQKLPHLVGIWTPSNNIWLGRTKSLPHGILIGSAVFFRSQRMWPTDRLTDYTILSVAVGYIYAMSVMYCQGYHNLASVALWRKQFVIVCLEFGVYLTEFTVDTSVVVEVRQLASLLLKQYVEVHWSQHSDKFRQPETSERVSTWLACLSSAVEDVAT